MGVPLGPLDPNDPAVKVLQTLPPIAKWHELLLPKIFGDLVAWVEEGVLVSMWNWRGRCYLEKAIYLGDPRPNQEFLLPVGLRDEEYEVILESLADRTKGKIVSIVNTDALTIRTIVPDAWISVEDQYPDPGVMVIAYYKNEYGKDRRIRAFYAPEKTIEAFAEDEFTEHDPVADKHYLPAGWYEANEFEEIHHSVDARITHWLPLPDPPAAGSPGPRP